ncbi:MAG: twin-arginine translocase subunit TatC [Deltaproteobacteria bacterium]|nr:twin-arginine translocase subunit TatC [Deltaproteobacteria bacterium]
MDRATLFKQLETLRWAFIRVALYVLGFGLLSYAFSRPLLLLVQRPLGLPLYYYGLPDAFLANIRIGLFGGLFLAVPFVFRELWVGLVPLVLPDYRRYSVPVIAAATVLFLAGATLCYFVVLPSGVQFLISYQTDTLKPMISLKTYVTFCVAFIFAFGFVFEMPLVLLVLNRAGLVSRGRLVRQRRYAVLASAIISAVLTPTPDVYNMMLMMVPMVVLYELSILVIRLFGRPEPKPAPAC